MSLGSNLVFLRKKNGFTQEDLAEKMEVTRQTVSKWESESGYPEMEKILALCDLFACDMETLVRGKVEDSDAHQTSDYDAHMNRFTRSICLGAAVAIFGVTMFLAALAFGLNEAIATMILMGFIAVSASFFITGGIAHSTYIKKHPFIKPFYKKEEIEAFDRKFPILIATGAVIVLLGVILLIGSDALAPTAGFFKERWEDLFVAVFMLFVTVAAPVFIYAGIQKYKYDLDTYNKENARHEESTEESKKIEKWSGVIMMTAVIAFLVLGFVFRLWNIGWIVFPVGGILCGIVSLILKK